MNKRTRFLLDIKKVSNLFPNYIKLFTFLGVILLSLSSTKLIANNEISSDDNYCANYLATNNTSCTVTLLCLMPDNSWVNEGTLAANSSKWIYSANSTAKAYAYIGSSVVASVQFNGCGDYFLTINSGCGSSTSNCANYYTTNNTSCTVQLRCWMANGTWAEEGTVAPNSSKWVNNVPTDAIPYAFIGTTPVASVQFNGCGNYYMTVNSGCTPTCNVPTPQLSVTQPTCTQSTGSIAVTNLPSGYYSKLDNGSALIGQTSYTNIAAGSHTLTIGSGTCTASTTFTINSAPSAPTPQYSVVQPTCSQSTGSISITNLPSGYYSQIDNGSPLTGQTGYTNIATGIHTLIIGNGACISYTTFTINAASSVPTPQLSVTQPTCSQTTGSISITNLPSGYYSKLDNGSTLTGQTSYANIAAGSHTLTIGNGSCSAYTTFTINSAPSVPTPQLSVTQPTCLQTTGSISITNLPSGYYSKLDNGSTLTGQTSYANIPVGSHTLTIGSGSCSAYTTFIINSVPSAPTPQLSVTQPTCAQATGSVTVTNLPSGYYSKLENTFATTGQTTYTNIAAGSHTLTIGNGSCTAYTTFTINSVSGAPTPQLNVTQPTCTQTTGSISITNLPSGYYSQLDNGSQLTGQTSYTNIAAGSHTLTIGNGSCTAYTTFTINSVSGAPTPQLSVTQPTCTQTTGSITITNLPSGYYSKLDNGSQFTGQTSYTNIAAGSHTLTIGNGSCTAYTTFTINSVSGAPTPQLSVTQPNCTQTTGSITITNLPSGYYSKLDNGSQLTGQTSYTNIAAGSHTLTIGNGSCTAYTTFTINASSGGVTPQLSVVQPTCSQTTGSVTVTNLPSGYYTNLNNSSWSAQATYPSLAVGIYTLYMSSTSNCITSATFTVNAAPSAPTPQLSVTQPTCTQTTGSITITNLPSGYYSKLDNGSTLTGQTTYTNIAAGSHTLTIGNGSCTAYTTFTINPVSGAPTPQLSVTQPTCTQTTGSILITNLPSGYYSKLDNGSTLTGQTSYTNIAAGSHTLTIGNGSCTAYTTFTINSVSGAPTPQLSVTQPTCTQTTGSITITNLPSGYYSKLDNGSTLTGQTNYTNIAAGSHTLTIGNGSCTAYTTFTINSVSGVPTPQLSVTQPNCTQTTGSILITNLPSGYYSQLDNGSQLTGQTAYTNIAAGSHTLTIGNGSCTAYTTFTINSVSGAPTPQLNVTQPTCTQTMGSITITNLPSGYYSQLDNGSTLTGQTNYTNIAAGSHTLTIGNGSCTASTTFTINSVSGAPTPQLNVTQPTCTQTTGSISITNLPSGYYSQLDNGSQFTGQTAYTNIAAGSHTLTIGNGSCTAYTTFTINSVSGAPTPQLSVTQPNCTQTTGSILITNLPSGYYSQLDNGSQLTGQTSYTNIAAGSHTLTIGNGSCTAYTTFTINSVSGAPTPQLNVTQPNCTQTTGSITITNLPSGYYSKLDNGSQLTGQTSYTNIAAGSHTLTIGNGSCTASTTFTINSVSSAPTPQLNVTQPTCTQTTGSISITNLPSGYYSQLDNSSQLTGQTAYTNIAAGSHTLTIGNGSCTASTTFTINSVSGAPTPQLNVTQPTCTQTTGSISITNLPSGYYSQLDNGSQLTGQTAYTNIAAGSHTLTIGNGSCTAYTTFTINSVSSAPTPQLNVTQPTCTQTTGSITITNLPSGYYSQLDNGSQFTGQTAYTNIAAGSHTLTIGNGSCTAYTTFTINSVSSAPTPQLNVTQPTCTQTTGSISITNLPSGYYSQLDNGSQFTGQTAYTNIAAGSHTLTIGNGSCNASTTFTINSVSSAPTPQLNVTQPTCTQTTGSISITNLPSGYYSQLDNGSQFTGQTAYTNIAAGSHTLTIGNGSCNASTTFTINSAITPTISFTNCPSNINLTASTVGGCASATWSAPTASSNCGTPSVTSNYNSGFCFPVGTTTVIYTATLNGVSKTCSFTVTVTAPDLGSIGDFVFCDNNNNRVYDNGDAPISGVIVTLCNSNNVVIKTATTNTSGNYVFSSLAAGAYIVKFPATLADGKNITTTNPITVNLAAGQNYVDADAGYYKAPILGSIGDFVFCDNNNNRVYDNGDAPISGVIVTLCNSNNVVIKTATTNTSGNYVFSSLAAGAYIVKFPATLADGKNITTTNPITVNLAAGQNYVDADAGYYKPTNTDFCSNPEANVTTGSGLITIAGITSSAAVIQVFNSSWASVYNQQINATNVTISNLPTGVYYVKVSVLGSGGTWPATCEKMVTVSVTGGPNNPPVANNDNTTTTQVTPVTITPLSNDQIPSGCTVQGLTITQQSQDGTAVVSGNNFIFTPAAGFSGTTTFKYRINSSCGNSNEATVTVVVTKVLNCDEARNNTISKSCVNNKPTLTGTALAGYEYMWLSSTSACPSNANQAIPNATSQNYTLPSAVTQTTYFSRCARPIGCTTWGAVTESNCITVTPTDCASPTTDCDAVVVTGNTNGTISITGMGTYTSFIQIFTSQWQPISNQQYNQSSVSISLKNGAYIVKVQLYNTTGSWQLVCEKQFNATVSGGLNALSKNMVLDINAIAEAQRAQIQWVNNTGSQNDFFTVEKLNNVSGNFEKIETVNSKPTEGNEAYSVYDNAVTEGDNTYRVQLTMLDGQVKTSAVKTLTYKNLNDIRIYPNPASDYIEVDLKQYEGKKVSLYIYNQVGQLVQSQQIERASTTPVYINLDKQTSSQMLLRVTAEGHREVTKKFVIQN